MSGFESAWDNFQAAWSAIPADQRTKLLRENLSPDCVYTDPNGMAHGYDEITERLGETWELSLNTRQFPLGPCATELETRSFSARAMPVSERTEGWSR